MSKTVDDRIVQLEFDNGQFEKGVSETLKTLDKLNDSLKLDDAAAGFSSISDAARRVDLSSIGASVDSLSDRFSTLRMIGLMALDNIVDSVMGMAKKLGSVLSAPFEQIKSGGWARAMNIEDAKFQLEGLGVAWNSIKDDIDYGVKDTAYGLDAAAKAASQLSASGVQVGDSMKMSLRAISGVAAMTSSTYEDISPIFTTVAGQGKLMTMQLRQLESRGLNAAATLAKSLGTTEAAVRDMVTHGEIDFNTFAKAMDDAFGEHAKDANKTFTGALSNIKAALSRIGAEFATPLINDAIPVLNSIRNMINAIKGNMGEVFNIFSKITSALSNKLTVKIDGITSFLKNDFTGLENINKALYISLTSIVRIMKAVKEAFSSVFTGSLGDHINNMAVGFEKVAIALQPTEAGLHGFKTVLTVIFSVIKTVGQAIGWLASNIGGPLVRAIITVTNLIFGLIGKLGDFGSLIKGVITNFKNFDSVLEVLRKHGIDLGDRADKIRAIFEKISDVAQKASKVITSALKGIGTAIALIAATPIYLLYQAFQKLMTLDWSKFTSALTNAKDLIVEFIEKVKNLPVVQNIITGITTAFLGLVGGLAKVGEALKNGFEALANGEVTLESLKEKILSIPEALKSAASKISGILSGNSGFGKIGPYLDTIRERIVDWIAGIQEAIKGITPAKVLLTTFAVVIAMLAVNANKLTKNISDLVTTATSSLSELTDFLTHKKTPFDKFKETVVTLTVALVALAGSLKLLSTIPTADLWNSVGALGVMVGGFVGLAVIVGLIEKFAKISTDIKNFASSMAIFGVGVAALAAALKIVSTIPVENIKANIITLSIIIAEMVTASILISKFASGGISGAIGMLGFAVAVVAVAHALQKLDGIDLSGIKGAWPELLAILLGVAALSKALASVGIAVFTGAIAFILAGKLLISRLEEFAQSAKGLKEAVENPLQKMKDGIKKVFDGFSELCDFIWEQLKNLGYVKGALLVVATVAVVVVIVRIVQAISSGVADITTTIVKNGKNFKKAAVGIAILAGVVAALIYFSKYVGQWMDESPNMTKALGIIAGLITLLGTFTILARFGPDESTAKALKKMFTSLGFVMLSIAAFLGIAALIPEEDFDRAYKAMNSALTVIGIFVVLATLVGSIGKGASAGFGTFAGLTLLFAAMMGSLAALMIVIQEEDDYKKLIVCAGTISALIIVLAALMYNVSKIKYKATPKTLWAMIGGLGAIGLAIAGLANLLPNENYIGKVIAISASMVLVLGALIGLMALINKISKDSKYTVTEKSQKTITTSLKGIGALALALVAVAAALAILKNNDPAQTIAMAGIVVLVLAALVGISIAMQALTKKFKLKDASDTVKILGVLTGVFAALALIIGLLSRFGGSADRMIATSQVIVLVLAELVAISVGMELLAKKFKLKEAKDTIAILMALTAVFAVLAVTIGALSVLGGSADRMLAVSQVIVLVVAELAAIGVGLGLLSKKAKDANKAIPILVTLTAVYAALGGVIAIAEQIGGSADRMLATSQVITLVVGELVGLTAILGVLGTKGIKAAASIPILIVLTAVYAALGAVIIIAEQIGGKADRMLATSQVIMLVLGELVGITAILGLLEVTGLAAMLAVPAMASLVAFYAALGIVIVAVEKLGGKADRMLAVSQVISLVLLELVGLTALLGLVGPLGALAVLAIPALASMLVAFTAIGAVLLVLQGLNVADASEKAELLTSVLWKLVAMTAVFALLSVGVVGLVAGAASMAILVASILGLTAALKLLEPISYDNIEKGLTAIGRALEIIILAGAGATAVAGGLVVLSGAIISLGVGCLAAGAGVKMFASAIESLASTTPAQLNVLTTTVIAFFSAIGVGISNGLRTITVTISAGIQVIIAAIVAGIKQLKSSAINEARGFLPDLVKALFSNTSSAKSQAKASGTEIGDSWVSGFRNSKLGWHSPPEIIKQFFDDTVRGINQEGKRPVEAMKDAATTAGNSFSKELTDTLSKLNLGGLGDSLGAVLGSGVLNGASGPLGALANLFSSLIGGATKKTQAELVDMYRTGQMSATEFNSKMAELNNTNKTGIDITDSLTGALGGLSEGLTGAGGAAGGAKSQMQEFQDSLRSTLESQMNIFDKFEEKAAMSKEELLSNMQSQINGMSNWAANMDKLSTMGIDKGLYKKLAEMGPQGAEYVGAFASMTGDEMARANDLWAQSLVLPGNVAAQLSSSWSGISEDMIGGLSAGWTDNEGQFHERILKTSQDAQEEFKADNGIHSPSTVYTEFGYDMMRGLRKGVIDNRNLITTAIKQIANLAISQARSDFAADKFRPIGANAAQGLADGVLLYKDQVKASAHNVGANLSEGLLEGIRSRKAEIYAELEEIGKKSAETLQKVTKEHSPSKVFEEIGKNWDLGLINGIRGSADKVYTALDHIGEESIEAMKYTIANIAAQLVDEMEDPVITPVLDLSKVQAGVRTLNSTFSTNQALTAAASMSDLQNGESVNSGTTFIQNNYSPKALSRIDIYRDTRNLFAQAKGALS